MVKKVAFVLSGGGSRGALEVGALSALIENKIIPHILVGTSVGAINAAALAINPTLEGVRWLEKIWRGVVKEAVIPQNYLSMVWRLVIGESGLINNTRLRNLLEANLPQNVHTFEDIKGAEIYITSVVLQSGELHVFGVDRSESIVDAAMASTALPPFLSPWCYRNKEYIDGGVVNDLPIRIAIEKHSTEIFAIDVGQRRMSRWYRRGVFGVMGQTIDAVLSNRVESDLDLAHEMSECKIHYICIEAFEDIRLWDFRYTEDMIEDGRRVTIEYLKQHGLIE